MRDRARPEYDARGIRAGGFIFYPDLTESIIYDDNIYAEQDNTTSDFINVLSPQVQLRSDWNNHELNLGARADIGNYFSKHREDYEDMLFEGAGRVDFTRQTNLYGTFAHAKRHEDRASPDAVAGVEPTEFDTDQILAGASHTFNRVTVNGDAELRRFDFDDVQSSTGSFINNDDRDRRDVIGTATVSYEIQPEFSAFVRGLYNARQYDDSFDDNGLDRESQGYQIVAGTAIDFTGVLFGNVFIGYLSQDFQDPRLSTVSGLTGGFDLTWNPTRLTTINGLVDRSVEETTIIGASGVFATRFSASVDHELFRNLLLNAAGGVTLMSYGGVDRDDTIYRFQASAKYLFNRNLYVTLGYEFSKRNSTGTRASEDFTVNTLLLRLESQL